MSDNALVAVDNKYRLNYGKAMREEIFCFDKDYHYTNSGSFGSVPKEIMKKRYELQLELEKVPEINYRFRCFELWNENRKKLADYLTINDKNLVFVENVTDSINSIIRSINFNGSKDAILALDHSFPSILNSIDFYSKYRLEKDNYIQVFKVPILFPINDKQYIVNQFDMICENIVKNKNLRIRLAILDHISCSTAVIYPLNEIISVIRKWSKLSNDETYIIIEGAQSMGQIEIKINDIDCDFYVSNLSKWFLTPRGCAFLYFRDPKMSKILSPNIIGLGYGKDSHINYFWRGIRDNTSWFFIEDSIRYFEVYFGGLKSINEYTSKLLDEAVKLLVDGWNTSELSIPHELKAPYMRVIKMPKLRNFSLENQETDGLGFKTLLKHVFDNYKVSGVFSLINGEFCCRISCFLHSCIEDYIALRDAIIDLM